VTSSSSSVYLLPFFTLPSNLDLPSDLDLPSNLNLPSDFNLEQAYFSALATSLGNNF